MKRMRNIIALALALIMVLSLAACGGKTGGDSSAPSGSQSGGASTAAPAASGDDTVYNITIGGTVPDDHPISQGLFKFKEVAEELSGGRFKVEVYDNNTIGASRELVEGVQANEIQMAECSQSVYASFTDELMSVGLPFLFKNRQAGYDFFDSEVGDQIADVIAEQTGVRIVGYFENGIRQLTNSKRPVTSPDDMKGLKIRVMESPLYIEMFTEMGANPSPMAFSELYTALQQGTVDGQDNPWTIVSTNAFYEVQSYATDLSHTFDITCFSINDKFYQDLPDDLREVVDKAAEAAVETNRTLSIELENEYIATIEGGGCQITHLTDEQRQVFRDATAGCYDWFRQNYNPTVSLETVMAKAEEVNAAN